jgi:hypothetical protein
MDRGKIIPDPSSSGSEMNLKKNYPEKLVKFYNFSTKMLNLKAEIPFCQKKAYQYIVIKMSNLAHLQGRNTKARQGWVRIIMIK